MKQGVYNASKIFKSMELFAIDSQQNRLPYDGCVNYYGPIIAPRAVTSYYDILRSEIDWKNDEAIIFGKRIITKRKVAWYGGCTLCLYLLKGNQARIALDLHT